METVMLIAKASFFLLCLLGFYARARGFDGTAAVIFGAAGYIAGAADVSEYWRNRLSGN